MLFAFVLQALMHQTPSELSDYVSKPDGSFRWSLRQRLADRDELELTSQTWRGIVWRHDLVVVRPKRNRHPDTALLVVTGDRAPKDLMDARALAAEANMSVAMLFDVPNQPIWNLREDALIAHTFAKFLETGEPDWPLVFPMAKSVVRAMDCLQAYMPGVKRFVVTGMSKRGWTTWLVGALGDKRVAGIAPMIFDFLNIPAQLQHQLNQWGRYSEMLADYSEQGLPSAIATPEGRRLARIVDPYSYLASITIPTLIIRGSNDPFWTVDATSIYWGALKQPHWLLTLPNVGHSSGNGKLYFSTLGAFARSCAGEFLMPKPSWKFELDTDGEPSISIAGAESAGAVSAWTAESRTTDFRASKWRRLAMARPRPSRPNRTPVVAQAAIHFCRPAARNLAIYVSSTFRRADAVLTLSSPTRVFKKLAYNIHYR